MCDIEDVKAYLNGIREADEAINRKSERVDEIRSRLIGTKSPSYSADRVQTSPRGDSLSYLTAELVDLQTEIDADIDALVDLKREIEQKVLQLEYDESRVIFFRYFRYMSMDAIAKEMDLSVRKVYYLHGDALKHFLRYMNVS